MKKTSQKIIMSGMIALQSLSAIASPHSVEFESPKAEYVQTKKVNQDYKEEHKEAGMLYFQHLNQDKEISFEKMLLEEKSGVFKNPFKEGEIMVISFQNKENLRISHDEIKKDLEEKGLLDFSTYERHRNKELSKKYTKTGSFHSLTNSDEVDYNFISYSVEQLKKFYKSALDNGYSNEMAELLPYVVLLHEMGHTHNHQGKAYQDLEKGLENFSEEEQENLKDKIMEKIKLIDLGGENYSDSFMLMMMAKMEKERNPENGLKNINELGDYFINHFRSDHKKNDEFDVHASKATVKTTIDFINNNWDVIDQLTHKNTEQLAASMTNGTLNNPEINSDITSHRGQKRLANKGGLSDSIMKKVSKNVNKEVQKMLTLSINEEGETELSFNYKQNAHEHKNSRKNKR